MDTLSPDPIIIFVLNAVTLDVCATEQLRVFSVDVAKMRPASKFRRWPQPARGCLRCPVLHSPPPLTAQRIFEEKIMRRFVDHPPPICFHASTLNSCFPRLSFEICLARYPMKGSRLTLLSRLKSTHILLVCPAATPLVLFIELVRRLKDCVELRGSRGACRTDQCDFVAL